MTLSSRKCWNIFSSHAFLGSLADRMTTSSFQFLETCRLVELFWLIAGYQVLSIPKAIDACQVLVSGSSHLQKLRKFIPPLLSCCRNAEKWCSDDGCFFLSNLVWTCWRKDWRFLVHVSKIKVPSLALPVGMQISWEVLHSKSKHL